jgi:hypothetical protein
MSVLFSIEFQKIKEDLHCPDHMHLFDLDDDFILFCSTCAEAKFACVYYDEKYQKINQDHQNDPNHELATLIQSVSDHFCKKLEPFMNLHKYCKRLSDEEISRNIRGIPVSLSYFYRD